jgi:hypothetical protein
MSTITPPLPSFGGLLHIMPLVVKVCEIAPIHYEMVQSEVPLSYLCVRLHTCLNLV